MTRHDTLQALITNHLAAKNWSKRGAAKRAGISYRQFIRLCNGDTKLPTQRVLDKLEGLGLDRRKLVLAAYGRSQKRD